MTVSDFFATRPRALAAAKNEPESARLGIPASLVIALVVGALFSANVWWFYANMPATTSHSDIAQVHAAARFLVAGRDPYPLIGLTGEYFWGYPLLYPLTGVLPLVPFASLSEHAVAILWPGIAFAVLAFALARSAQPVVGLVGLLSIPALIASQNGQWSPLLTASMLLPPVAVLAACKPSVAAPMMLAAGREQIWWAVIGGIALLLVSLAVMPRWPLEWRATFHAAPHVRPPLLRFGGVFLLLSATRWRDRGAQILLALSVAPQTPVFYEALPLILIPRTLREQLFLSLAGFAAWQWKNTGRIYIPTVDAVAYFDHAWLATLWGCYVPALLLVLLRKREPT